MHTFRKLSKARIRASFQARIRLLEPSSGAETRCRAAKVYRSRASQLQNGPNRPIFDRHKLSLMRMIGSPAWYSSATKADSSPPVTSSSGSVNVVKSQLVVPYKSHKVVSLLILTKQSHCAILPYQGLCSNTHFTNLESWLQHPCGAVAH